MHYQASNFSEALEHCLRALDVYHTTGQHVDTGNILNTIAAIYHSMGDNDRAIVTYEQALAASEPFGRQQMIALILGNIARIRSSRSEYLPAVSMGKRAVEIARDHNPSIVTNLLADLAEAYMGLADRQRAAECFAEARRVLSDASAFGAEPSPSAQLGVMVAEGRVALRSGALDDAIAVLQAALDMSERTEAKEYELEINDLLATAFKRAGRFEEALERRERHDAQYRKMFTHAADLRLRTLQVAHDTATARQQAEIFRLRTQELEVMVNSDDAAARRLGDGGVAAPRGVRASGDPHRVPRRRDRRAHEPRRRPGGGDRARHGPSAGVVRAAADGGAPARRRQGGGARLRAAQDRAADGRGVRDDEVPHEHGAPHPRRELVADVPDGGRDRAVAPRVVGRQRLPARASRTTRSRSPGGSSASPTCTTRCAASARTSGRGRGSSRPSS